MKKATKLWLIIGVCLIVVGVVIAMIALANMDFDFRNLSTQKMQTNIYTPEDEFDNILVDVNTADVSFVVAQDGKTKVVCYEEEKAKHTVGIANNGLVITEKNDRKWYDHIGIHTENATVTVYLPAELYYGEFNLYCTTGDISMAKEFAFAKAKVKTTTGDVEWNANTAGKLEIRCTTGDVTVQDVHCGYLEIEGTTTDVKLKDTVAVETLKIKVTTGDVNLDRVDATELHIKATTGDVTGTLVSDKVFDTKATTGMIITSRGEVVYDPTKPLEICKVETTTGDIHLEIVQ